MCALCLSLKPQHRPLHPSRTTPYTVISTGAGHLHRPAEWRTRISPRIQLAAIALLCLSALHAQQQDVASSIARSDWPAAEAAARAELKSHPHNADAWTFLGISSAHLNHAAESLHAFREAASNAPASTATHNNYGAALETAGQTASAISEYRRSLALDAYQPAPLVNLARLLYAQHTTPGRAEATSLLTRAWSLAPDEEIARTLLTLAPCASASTPVKAPPPNLQPYADFEAAHAADVPYPSAPELGRATLSCGFKQQAAQIFATALQSYGENPQLITGLAQAQLATGEPREAGITLETAVAHGMESPAVYAALARVYQQTGHLDHSIDSMQRAIALDPQSSDLQFRYGMLLLDTPAPKAAEVRLQQAVHQHPDAPRLWFALGLAFFEQTDPAKAEPCFDHAVQLEPGFAPALAYRGLTALDQQRYPEAEQWYRRAIAADPAAADFHLLLSEALEREHPGDPAPARDALQQTVALDPNSALAYVRLGRLDLDAGDAAKAVEHLSHALALDPKQISAHFYLARAYRRLHDPDRAGQESKLFDQTSTDQKTADHLATQSIIRQVGHMTY